MSSGGGREGILCVPEEGLLQMGHDALANVTTISADSYELEDGPPMRVRHVQIYVAVFQENVDTEQPPVLHRTHQRCFVLLVHGVHVRTAFEQVPSQATVPTRRRHVQARLAVESMRVHVGALLHEKTSASKSSRSKCLAQRRVLEDVSRVHVRAGIHKHTTNADVSVLRRSVQR